MGLADEFDLLRKDWRPTNGGRCFVGELRAVLDKADLEAFDALLADTRIYATAIIGQLDSLADKVTDDGLAWKMRAVTQSSIQRHRRHGCRCER